jgi:hypothetical protein
LLSKISIAYAIGGFHKDRSNDNSSVAKLVLPAVRKKNFFPEALRSIIVVVNGYFYFFATFPKDLNPFLKVEL